MIALGIIIGLALAVVLVFVGFMVGMEVADSTPITEQQRELDQRRQVLDVTERAVAQLAQLAVADREAEPLSRLRAL